MKNSKFLFIAWILLLFCVTGVSAQTTVRSGSFQFTNEMNKRSGVLVLQSGTQQFDFPISDNIIIANLLPGRYSLFVEYPSSGRGGTMTKISQTIEIESERTTICRLNTNARLSFAKEFDKNSISLVVANHFDHFDRNDNFNNNRKDDRRDDRRVVPPPPTPISESDFSNLYNAVKNEKFSDTKMRMLKTSSDYYPFFTSEQVKRLALLFSFENDKLECAKYLTHKVLDVQNLPFIKDIFSFDSTKNDYLRFLNGR